MLTDQLYRKRGKYQGISFIRDKFSVRGEVEYTVAAYGNKTNSLAVVQNASDVANIRFLLSVNYNF